MLDALGYVADPVLRANGTAREAEQTGMVKQMVDLDRLQDETMELAYPIIPRADQMKEQLKSP